MPFLSRVAFLRHLEVLSKSVQHMDLELTRTMAFQEGLQAGQRLAARGSGSMLFMAMLTGAAMASGTTVLLMRAKYSSGR